MTWAPRTKDSGCSSWLTAQARDWKGLQGRSYQGRATDLPQAVKEANWPTPDTQNVRNGSVMRTAAKGSHAVSLHHAVAQWATPAATIGWNAAAPEMTITGMMPDGTKRQVGLELQVRMTESGNWNTPRASDWKNLGIPQSCAKMSTMPGDLARAGMQGLLNPDWVEVLMGYEPGWTRLPPDWKRSGGPPDGGLTSMNGSRAG